METSVSAQLYVMILDSLCCSGKDNRPQNQHSESRGEDSGGIIMKMCTSMATISCKEDANVSFGTPSSTRNLWLTSGKAVRTMLCMDKGKPTAAQQLILTHNENQRSCRCHSQEG